MTTLIERLFALKPRREVVNGNMTSGLPTDRTRTKPGFPVTFDASVQIPSLDCKVWIEGNCFRTSILAMFARADCRGAASIEEADLVVFSGGEDVHPSYYDEKPVAGCYYNERRDEREALAFARALELEKPMFGICRGFQLIHALSGSKLYQDVMNHGKSHLVTVVETGEHFTVSSMHHQMCIADGKQLPVLLSHGISGRYEQRSGIIRSNNMKELEGAYYPEFKAFGVQGHPEVGGYDRFTEWTLQQLERLLYDSDLPKLKVRADAKKTA